MKSLFRFKPIFYTAVITMVIFSCTALAVKPDPSPDPTISINTINGIDSPFNFVCPTNPLFSPVMLTGDGTGSAPPGQIEQYHVQIDWGDGQVTNNLGVFDPSSGQGAFNYTFNAGPHSYDNGVFNITARLYHAQPPGNDNQEYAVVNIPVCVVVEPPILTVVKNVINDDGGTSTASDFNLYVKIDGEHVFNSPAPGSETGTIYTLNTGTFIVSEDAVPGYTQSFSGDCDENGNITLASGDVKICTIINDDIAEGCPEECDDGLWCNGTETCNLETHECQPGTPPDCDDSVGCTDDSCDEYLDRCVNEPNDENCSADEWVDTGNTQWISTGQCTEKEQKEQEYIDYYCDLTLDCQYNATGTQWIDTGETRNKQDETPCNDGDLCTENDVCSAGVCSGVPMDCDDGIECTVDKCVGGICQHDTSACACIEDADCDDSNPCTDNTCNLETYSCEFVYNTNQCDDNNLCTENDVCLEGLCYGMPVDCCDNNVCTDDSCNPEIGCVYASNTASCDDGDACTTDDVCSDGVCSGVPMDCDDGIECTVDKCVGGICQHDDSACPPEPYCGDGFVNGDEVCEIEDIQPCTSTEGYIGIQTCNQDCMSWSECQTSEYCGDGIINDAEECDDGNNEDGDGCSANCILETECTPDETQICDTGLLGVCSAGTQTCDEYGCWGYCIQDIASSTEICDDGLDNDCDGDTDCDDADCADASECAVLPPPVIYGGSSGGAAIGLHIFNEENEDVLSDQATVSWFTSTPATSRVIYDIVPHAGLSSPPNYGYAYSTAEDSDRVTFRTVTITGLTPGTTYYWRALSHGSPEVWGKELVFTVLEEVLGEETETEEEEIIVDMGEEEEGGEVTGEESVFEEEVAGEESIIEEEEEPAEEEEPIVAAEEKEFNLLAAIGDIFNSGNLCWLFFLLVLILLVLAFLSLLSKKRKERKNRWIMPLITVVLVILYCIFCGFWRWLLIILSAGMLGLSLLPKKKNKEKI